MRSRDDQGIRGLWITAKHALRPSERSVSDWHTVDQSSAVGTGACGAVCPHLWSVLERRKPKGLPSSHLAPDSNSTHPRCMDYRLSPSLMKSLRLSGLGVDTNYALSELTPAIFWPKNNFTCKALTVESQ